MHTHLFAVLKAYYTLYVLLFNHVFVPTFVLMHVTCLSLDSFLHKNPEDLSEVPNGFLSDINPVSVDPNTSGIIYYCQPNKALLFPLSINYSNLFFFFFF